MRIARFAWAAIGATALLAASAHVYAEDAVKCMTLSELVDDKAQAVDFRLANACKASFDCSLSWRVICDGGAKTASSSATLVEGSSATITASAAFCKGDWEVRDPAWTCNAHH
jgi:hypothetical protein